MPASIQSVLDQAIEDHRQGRLQPAESAYRQVLAEQPDNIAAMGNLGLILQRAKRLDESVALFRRLTELTPQDARAHHQLGMTLGMMGRVSECIGPLRRAVQLKPDSADILSTLGNALRELGELADAEAVCRRAISFNPSHAAAHCNLSAVLQTLRRHDEAIVHARRAIALSPEFAEAHYNLGVALGLWALSERRSDRPELEPSGLGDAVTASRRALELKPDFAEAHSNIGSILQKQGKVEAAIVEMRRAVELAPSSARAHSNLLLALHYISSDPEQLFQEHLRWGRTHGSVPRFTDYSNDRSAERKLTIGLVSADFRRHSVAFFLEPILAGHDRGQFEIICYSDVAAPDDTTRRLQGYIEPWRPIAFMPDDRVAEIVRQDRVDILLDLGGHTSNNRLTLFARKAAPIQVTYLGYPNTTGLNAIDYRITDAQADPPGMTDRFNTEKLVRLPRTAWCYRPPRECPEVAARGGRDIVFGSFNALPKLADQWIALWSEILQSVPRSRLLLKNLSLRDPGTRDELRARFARESVADRIELIGANEGLGEHLAAYNEVDIALDTFPYHGTTTMCEELWMGAPVMTMEGQMHHSRVGVSLVNGIGLPELVARSPQEYVKIAAELAADDARRIVMRKTMRERMASAPLMDEQGFVTDFEAALRKIWRTWCSNA
jgi:protein O-GlcNAc transferase